MSQTEITDASHEDDTLSGVRPQADELAHSDPETIDPEAAEPRDATYPTKHYTASDRNGMLRLLLEELAKPRRKNETDIALQAGALMHDAFRERASDVHIDPDSSGWRVRFRIDGSIVNAGLLSRAQGNRVVNQIMALSQMDPVNKFVPEEARFTHPIYDRLLEFRVELAPCLTGNKFTIRILEPKRFQQRIYDLGLAQEEMGVIQDWLGHLSGMFIIAGPTGSGKTTTLYALLHELKLLDCSVVTVEDPVECQIDGVSQIQVDEARGLTFAEGI
jgi:type II secretory ATPase GspE/PulE/Tfp pilus assembly ATPase PilB-like protein